MNTYMLSNMEGILSRSEMKGIMAGTHPCGQVCSNITVACVQYVVDTWHPSTDDYAHYLTVCENQTNACFTQCQV